MSDKKLYARLAVYLILENQKNQVLLLRRFNTGWGDGQFSLPAGHVEIGETVIQALIRETQEEIGLNLEELDIQLVHIQYRDPKHEDPRVDFFFHVKMINPVFTNREPHKCDLLKWFSQEKYPKNLIANVSDALVAFQNKQYFSQTLY